MFRVLSSFLRKQESRRKNWIPCQARNDITEDIIYAGVNNYLKTDNRQLITDYMEG